MCQNSVNTKESWHEFVLKLRVIADSRGYEEIIDGTKTPPEEKENLEILARDNEDTKIEMKEKLAARIANKKGEQRPCDVHRGHLIKHCRECNFRKVEQSRFQESMGETQEALEPQDQRG